MIIKKRLPLKKVLKNKKVALWYLAGSLVFVIALTTVVTAIVKSSHKPSDPVSARVGTVKALNDELVPLISSYNSEKDPTKKAQLLKQAENLAKEREQHMLELIKQEPAGAGQALLPGAVSAQFPSSVAEHVETATTISGKLVTVVAEGKVDGQARPSGGEQYDFYVDTAGGRVALHEPKHDKKLIEKTKQKVSVSGIKLNGQMALTSSGSVETTVTSSTQNVPGPKKVATLLVNFSNTSGSQAQPLSTDQARSTLFTSSSSVNNFYQTATFGKMSLTGKVRPDGDVFGWYTINYSNNTCDYDTWRVASQAAAQNAGVDLTGYDDVVMIFPYSSACGWAGLAEVSGSNVWINGAGNAGIHVISHELGHNYGLLHAAAMNCTDGGKTVTISQTCTADEYGDFYDPMGNLGFYHFSNFNKGRLGVLAPSNTQTVTTSGVYTIAPVEKATTGTMALRISRGSNFYYLEARANADQYDFFAPSDPAVTGVFMRMAPDYSQLATTYLMDGTPSTSIPTDRPLPVGQTFTESVRGIAIKVLSVNATGATVEVTLSAPPEDTTPPTQPTNLSGSAGIDSDKLTYIQLLWDASTDALGVTGYDIYRDGALFSSSQGWLYIKTGEPYNSSHNYYVVARDAAGNKSLPSNTVTITTPSVDTEPPTVPTSLKAQSPAPNQVNLTWQASTDNLRVQGYFVYRNGVQIAAAGDANFGDATVTPDVTYTYTVAAYDFSGNLSAQSAAVSIRTSGTTNPPPTNPPPPPVSTGGITGKVSDAKSGAIVTGATVKLLKGQSMQQSTVSDAFGNFSLSQIAPDNYSLEVSAPQYKRDKKVNVKVTGGSIIVMNVELRN
jgi:chitodextrinase